MTFGNYHLQGFYDFQHKCLAFNLIFSFAFSIFINHQRRLSEPYLVHFIVERNTIEIHGVRFDKMENQKVNLKDK